jgi:hypothetical protein
LGSLVLPAASIAITAKLYSDLASKSGSAIKVTTPEFSSMLNALASDPVRAKVKPSLISPLSSAVAN